MQRVTLFVPDAIADRLRIYREKVESALIQSWNEAMNMDLSYTNDKQYNYEVEAKEAVDNVFNSPVKSRRKY